MKVATARRHHYLPVSYLAGFTMSRNKDDQFFVFDVQTGKSFRTSPKNVAVERDFNRVHVDGIAPDAIENSLAPFEQQVVQAIETVLQSGDFPAGMDYHRILNLLCLIVVRNPSLRNTVNKTKEQVLRIKAEMIFSDESAWKQHLRVAGFSSEADANISFEDMKRFVREGEYTITFPTDSNLAIEFSTFNELLPVLGKRNWTLLMAPEGGPSLVCCDHPVVLTWKNRGRGPAGFGLTQTEVFFPLGRGAGFYGVFEDPLDPVVKLTPTLVASMNAKVMSAAQRHVYSSEPKFLVHRENNIREVILEDPQGG